jgi:hypothetical protein
MGTIPIKKTEQFASQPLYQQINLLTDLTIHFNHFKANMKRKRMLLRYRDNLF